ncbi:DNA binding protein [Vibrio phage D51]
MTKATTFEWNAETTSKATELYLAIVDEKGVEAANSKVELDAIAKELGAKSGASIRSKLSSEKVYLKPATKRKVGGSSKVPKMSYIRALQTVAKDNDVELNARNLESLESATVADIQDMIKIVEAVTGETVKIAGVEVEEQPKGVTARA